MKNFSIIARTCNVAVQFQFQLDSCCMYDTWYPHPHALEPGNEARYTDVCPEISLKDIDENNGTCAVNTVMILHVCP